MSVVLRGTSAVVTPRAAAGRAHAAETAATAPHTRDGDTFEAPTRRAAATGAGGSFRATIAVDHNASGAYFHKLTAPPRADAHGVRVEGRLPEVLLDPRRMALAGDTGAIAQDPVATTTQTVQRAPTLDAAMAQLNDWRTGPLDRPSVYVGGHAGRQEADVGLSFDRVYDTHGRATFTDLPGGSDLRQPAHRFAWDPGTRSLVDGNGVVVAQGDDAVKRFLVDRRLQPNFAFRPYWRVSPSEPGTQNWANPPVSAERAADWAKTANHIGAPTTNAYFYPGERFAMNVRTGGRGQLRLDIRGNGEDGAVPSFGVSFKASSFGVGAAQQWKRVSSIDQKGNEGGTVQATSSMAVGLVWEKTEILLGDARTPTSLQRLGPTQVRGRDLADSARYNAIFNVDVVDGAEIVTIRP